MSEAPDILLSYSRDDQVTAWRAAERSGRRGSIQARELIELSGSRHSSRAGRGKTGKTGRSVNRRPVCDIRNLMLVVPTADIGRRPG